MFAPTAAMAVVGIAGVAVVVLVRIPTIAVGAAKAEAPHGATTGKARAMS